MSAGELFLVLVGWSYLRWWCARWRSEYVNAYMWRNKTWMYRRGMLPVLAALRAFLP